MALRHRSKWTLFLSFFLLTTMAFADHPADLPTAMVMAAGNDFMSESAVDSLPFIASSINGGGTWEIRPITNLPAIYSSGLIPSCTGKGNNAVCIGAGFTIGKSIYDPTHPFVLLSQNGTKSWNFIDLTDQFKDQAGFINGIASMGSGKTAMIILTGEEGKDYHSPLILVSIDGGTHWISKGSSLGIKTELGTISCTGEGKTALCMATGNYSVGPSSKDPLFAISTDGGNTWASQRISPPLTKIFDINCLNGNTCIALGAIEESEPFIRHSVIKATTDKGKNWKDNTFTDSQIYSINCTGNGSATLCAAVGFTRSTPEYSFVAVSTDNGATWTSKPIQDNLPDSKLTSVSCTQTKGGAVCAAVGYGNYATPALVVISTDGGNTWQRIQNRLKRHIFHSVNCSPNGTSAYCVASANYEAEPTLAVSSDLLNWRILTSEDYTGPIPLPAWGAFSSAASTTSLALPRKKWDWKDKGESNHDK